jgi:hypothetical protein
MVAREGLEPSKPLGRQIYSLLRLTASLPRQLSVVWKRVRSDVLCCRWSWRRDLNPRPADYKSAALPTELRQPDQNANFSTSRATVARRRIPSRTDELCPRVRVSGNLTLYTQRRSHVRKHSTRRSAISQRSAAASRPRTARFPPPPTRSGCRRVPASESTPPSRSVPGPAGADRSPQRPVRSRSAA